jgi:hypothetical protein
LAKYKPLIVRALTSKTGRRIETAIIAYVVVELQRKGYLPMFPLPKA